MNAVVPDAGGAMLPAVLLDTMRVGVIELDLDGRIRYANAAAADLLGCAPQVMAGQGLRELTLSARADGATRPAQDGGLLHALHGRAGGRVEGEPMRRADGGLFHADCTLEPCRADGAQRGWVLTFCEVSHRLRAEEQARRVRCELEQRAASRSRELREALDELNAMSSRLRELSAHAESERENDRQRIAREIHDELGSVLVALKLDLSWLGCRLQDRPELVSKTVAMRRLLDNAVVEVGRIITDLRPSILDHQGLWAAMEWHAQEAVTAAGLDGRIDLDGVTGLPPPEGALATAAYRIFQEMLNNVARHAHATQVRIRVDIEDGGLVIAVKDNGRGISAQALENPRSYGLVGMYERARHFGGRVSVAPGREGGTRVRAWLPFETHISPPAGPALEVLDDSPADL